LLSHCSRSLYTHLLAVGISGCPYADFRRFFDEQAFDSGDNRNCFWPNVCQEEPKWERLAPPKFRLPEQINEPLGMKRAEQLARLLGIDEGMVLTEAENQCLIGTPPRTANQETIFVCIQNLTNSNGNAAIPLSSYGLVVNKQGNVQSVCAPGAPCINFNALLAGPLEKIALQCGFLEKLRRMETETPFRQLLVDAFPCQRSGEPACIVEAVCAGE
jgi:hypothetical protein